MAIVCAVAPLPRECYPVWPSGNDARTLWFLFLEVFTLVRMRGHVCALLRMRECGRDFGTLEGEFTADPHSMTTRLVRRCSALTASIICGHYIRFLCLPGCTGHVLREMDEAAYHAQLSAIPWGPIMGLVSLSLFTYSIYGRACV